MSSPISNTIYSTMLIENEWGGKGTGFLVLKITDPLKKEGKLFLITNKHVLNSEKEKREIAKFIKLHLNINDNGKPVGRIEQLDLEQIWKEHPDKDVDVMVFDVTSFVINRPSILYKCFYYDQLINKSKIEEKSIAIGDEIIVIGYPFIHGLKHQDTNFPFVRQGIIASRIGDRLKDKQEKGMETIERILRGFMIDGAIIHGSSGSPAILKPGTTRYDKDGISFGDGSILLLGIVSETRYAPIATPSYDFQAYANLGLAFDADTIRETIDLFF